MEKTQRRTPILHRVIAILLAFVLVAGYFPTTSGWKVSAAEPGAIDTVADPETLTRPTTIYGSNTLNAVKVTVGKSVATHEDTVKLGNNDQFSFTAEENNFIVTISQFAQVMGLTSETTVPVDVVFVLDTSGSMGKNNTNNKTGRAEAMVNAANSAIATLLSVNEHNRVAVVAFSSEGYGSGTSNDNAANLLSPLYHYTGNSATKHLQWVNSSKTAYTGSTTNTTSTSFGVGSNYNLIAGRNQQGSANGTRDGGNGGTNIQAGIALGAQQLTSVTDTTVTYEDGTTVTRMPFIVLLSDGAPTFSSSIETWYNPSQTAEQGPGSSSYAGNGFLTALTAAYYKGAVTEHYYGSNADSNNRCSIYTIGVQLNSQSNSNDVDLAQLTMDPTRYLSDTTNVFADDFHSYWDSFADGETFMVRVDAGTVENSYNGSLNDLVWIGEGEPGSGAPNRSDYSNTDRYNRAYNEWRAANYAKKSAFYTVTANTIAHAKNYVTGKTAQGATMYTGDVAYNDGYYNADQTSEIAAIFQDVVNEIQMKAISSPTQVSTAGANFSGYVHFSDPIGEYMEVRDMKGIVLGDQFYSGATFAELLKGYGANNATQKAFDQMLRDVLDQRMRMSGSSINAAEFVADALASANQANYTNDSNFDNSIVWWGSDYVSGNSAQLQVLAHADNDSVAYIEEQKAAGNIPAGAKYVCRSYFFYGNSAEDHEFMYFMLRVQRSLEAPYQQTVVISCPASLLSMEKVLITEESDGTYTASVTSASPARVVYEVGLRSDINAQNVDQIVNDIYREESVTGTGSVNYSNGAYNFFTNDWDRSQSNSSHHRAMTEASFEAAADNSFYTYQQDTLLLDASGRAVTGTVTAGNYYYVREYYDWTGKTPVNGSYSADKKTQLIKVEIDDPSILKQSGNNWYIPKGAYTASTLETTGDDVLKDDPNTVEDENITGTSAIVSHAHRTGKINDNDYAVALGNNGMLTLVSDPPKSVSIGNNTTNDHGKTVMVGETLTYKVKVVNNEGAAATAVVTDVVPTGTQLVAGSISHGGSVGSDGKTITWNLNLANDETKTVSFKVVVLPEALAGEQNVQNITNTATIQIGNNPSYKTNTVTNPPEGKKVVVDATEGADGIQVGDLLTYRIRFYNDTNETATVTVRDIVPAGTTFVSADHGGRVETSGENAGKVVWTIENVGPGKSGVVTFVVEVDASAKVQPGDDEIIIRNDAQIKIGTNGPWQDTNTTETKVGSGDVLIKKLVTNTDKQTTAYRFKVVLSESTGMLNGTYSITEGGASTTITFTNGESEITLWHDRAAQIHDLPEGVTIYVREIDLEPGWSASYEDNDGGYDPQRVIVDSDMLKTVTITNTYRVSPVTFQLKGTKNFTGSNFPAGNFTFNAKQVDLDNSGNVIDYSGTPAMVSAIVTHAGGTTGVDFTFSPRTFTEEETRYYLIDEAAVVIPGVTSSTKQYLLRLQVVDINAQLTVFAAYKVRESVGDAWSVDAGTADGWTEFDWENASVQFTNTHVPSPVTFAISGTKELENRYLNANEFSFELLDESKQVIATTTTTQQGSNTSPFAFNNITITADQMGGASNKSFTYYVREIQSGPANVTFDSSVYKIVVTIEDVGGVLTEVGRSFTKLASLDAVSGETKSAVAFVNTFDIQDVKVSLSGNKTLTGLGAKDLAAEEFTFVVYEANEQYVIGNVAGATGNAAGEKNGSAYVGAIRFSDISYTAEMLNDVTAVSGVKTKNFYYVVKEVIPGQNEPSFNPNMKYDESQYLIKVEVQLTVNSGELTAKIVEVNRKVGDVTTNLVTNGTADSFTQLEFSNIKNPDTVTYNPIGKKTTTGSNVPSTLKFSFRVVGMGTDIQALTLGNLEATGVSRGETSTADVIDFTALTYTSADVGKTYYYQIQEATSVTGNMVTYDETQYVLAVTVGRDANTKALTTSEVYYKVLTEVRGGVTISKDATDPDNWEKLEQDFITYGEVTYSNTYSADATLNITATKVLDSDGKRDLEANEFDFRLELLNDDGSLTGKIINGINSGVVSSNSNTINFGTLIFTQAQLDPQYAETAVENKDGENNVISTTYTYHYTALMSELVPDAAKIPGVSYDSNKYIVTLHWAVTTPADPGVPSSFDQPTVVAVYLAEEVSGKYQKANDTNLYQAPATGGSTVDTGITFTNSYAPTSTTVTIQAKKTLTGRPLSAGEFAFELYRDGTLVETATNDANGLVTFTRTYPSNISSSFFTADADGDGNLEATFHYTLKEVATHKGGVTYSDAVYNIEVTVEHDVNTAALSVVNVVYKDAKDNNNVIVDGDDADDTVDADEIVFANNYTTNDAHYAPVATKQLLGKDNAVMSLEGYTFSFQVYEVDVSGNRVGAEPASVGASDVNGTVTFSPITFVHNRTGEDTHKHYYEIVELPGSDPTITTDPTRYYLAVTITDDHNGTLTVSNTTYYASITDAVAGTNALVNGAEFVNHYGPGYVDIQLDITKHMNLVGTEEYNLQDGQFDFEVLDANGNVVTVGTNQAGGQSAGVTFGSIIITSEQVRSATDGKFVYTIREIVPDDAAVTGITVEAGRTITATVTVVDDGYGNLTYTVAYTDNDETAGNEQKFTNTYTANPVNFNIVGHKHLTGKHLAADEFEFELIQIDGEGNQVASWTVKNNVAGEVVFSMSYDKTGTYKYLLKEKGKGSGAVNTGEYTFDNHYYEITVVVADDTEGNLFVRSADKVRRENTSTYSLRGGLTQITGMDFYNTFTPTPLTIDLTTDIGGTKSVIDAEGNNRDDLAEGFQFEVRDISNNLVSEGVSKKVGNQVIIDFNDFTFNTEGEYHYWVYEKDVQAPFVKDAAIYEIHILVHKNMETGELYINSNEIMTFAYNELAAHDATSNEDPVVFVNKYLPDPTTVTITANKVLTGRDLKAGEFTFHLVEVIDGVDAHLIRSEVTNAANGKISFQLTYTTTGEHIYTIHEHAPADANKLPGVTYDERSYGTIKVTVVEQNGKLVATQGSSIASGVTITNKYEAAPVTAEVHAQKLLENKTLAKDDFTFQMKDEDGNVVATAKNDENGKISFRIPYKHSDLAGQTSATFVYTISEVKGEIPGVVYDENAYKVFITVSDDLHGYLKYAVIYENGMVPTFTNIYETDDAAVTIKAEKKLEGNTLKGEDFTFQLKDENGNVVATAKNDAEGKVRFDFLLEKAGEYTYTISELAGDDNHIIYDDNAYTVTVVVTDNGKGGLEHQLTYTGGKNEPPVFNNTYLPDATVVTVEASKQFTGKTLKADEFTFQLLDEEGKEVASAKNTVDGKISFQLDIDAEGTYVYTMVEKAGDNAQITYDAAKYKVTIKVTNVDGVLTPVVTYETEDGKAPVFHNTWNPGKIGITLTGTKTLTGRDMKAGEFKFQVHDSTGTLVATGTNDAKGKITFTPVGIVTKGTYLLTVSEVQGTAEYVTYDKATFQVKVVVENVDGVLVPTVTYPDGDIAFENSYDEPANPETGDNSPIYWMIGLLVISALAIVLLIALRPKKKGGKYAK